MRTWRRRRGENGASFVEFALVAPVLLALLMGGIDFGFVGNDSTKLRQVVRESGRSASVWRFGRLVCPDNALGLVGNTDGTGAHGPATNSLLTARLATSPNDILAARLTESHRLQCSMKLIGSKEGMSIRTAIRVVAFDHNGSIIPTDPLAPPLPPNPAPTVGNGVSYGAVVCAQFKTRSRTGLFRTVLNERILSSQITLRLSDAPVNVQSVFPADAQEEPFPLSSGPGNWDKCIPEARL